MKKKVDDNIIQKLLEMCKYINWKNINSEKKYYNLNDKELFKIINE